jgi:hypothetical protein
MMSANNAELRAAQEGAQKLTGLRAALESLRDHYGALFDDGLRAKSELC